MKSIVTVTFGCVNWKYLPKAHKQCFAKVCNGFCPSEIQLPCRKAVPALCISIPCQLLKQTIGQGLPFCIKHVELPECNSHSIPAQAEKKRWGRGENLGQQNARKAQSEKQEPLSHDEAENVKGK